MDSWLTRDGVTRGWAAHRDRFVRACAEVSGPSGAPEPAGVAAGLVERFLREVPGQVPDRGRWWPRVELVGGPGWAALQVWLRAAPPAGSAVTLWVDPLPDRRRRPSVKGADLEHADALGAAARARGADDTLIVSATGHVLEGASTSVLWWRDDALCAPPLTGELLAGVTRSILLAGAAAGGGRVREERVRPAELDGLEVWAVNALHGIRPVLGWIGGAGRPAAPRRAARWAGWLAGVACWPPDTGGAARE
jgi:hypothetical protein